MVALLMEAEADSPEEAAAHPERAEPVGLAVMSAEVDLDRLLNEGPVLTV